MVKELSTVEEYLGVIIDYSRDNQITEQGLALLTGKGFYKKEHETSPQQGLARAATCYCFGDYDFAQRIYDYASKGWFTFSGPPLTNSVEVEWPSFKEDEFEEAGDWLEDNVDPTGMPISCFTSGTPVMTKLGEKSIEKIQVGDEVLTHKGRFKKVINTRESYSADLYEIQATSKSTRLTVTGNHRMLTNLGWVEVKDLKKNVHLLATNEKINWDTSEKITLNVHNKEHKKYNTTSYDRVKVTEKITLTEDLAWALGFWFAEGSTADNGTIAVVNQDLGLIEKWNSIMSEAFGVKSTTHNPETKNWINGLICNKNLQEFFDNYFGKGCYKKKLPDKLMTMNKELFLSFYEGFYAGDGFKTTSHKAFELANTVFVSQLSLLLSKYGVKHNLQLRKKTAREGSYNGIVSYVEDAKRLGVRSGISMSDGLCYCTIDVLNKLDAEETLVHDIEVEEDHSFSVAGVVAHNCFLSYIPDTKEGLIETRSETAMLSMMGGGIGIYSGNRSPDDKSTGVMAHLRGYDADALSYRQTSARRGSIASYLDIEHPEILNFIEMRNPVGGDQNKKCFNLNNAVNISDSFMEKVILGEDYELIDPKYGPTGRMLPAKEVFEKVLEMRYETGEPYIMFKDTVNKRLPEWITHPLYRVHQSNLCSEITLRTSDTRTAVCCLSSLNLEKFDEWKDSAIVEDVITLLDNVLEYFIRLAPPTLSRAVNSANKERALGLGTLGWHSYLQKHNIPFESGGFNSATQKTHQIYSLIKERAVQQSLRLGTDRGECYDCYGSGMRNSHLLAIAPNANSSSRVGTSPSIEPWNSNAFNAQGRAGSFLIKNKYLEVILEELGKNTPDVWKSIILNEGSVEHLDFLSTHQKNVFKTGEEIDPAWIIELAAARQNYICQSQSVNIFVPKGITKQRMVDIHVTAWLKGLKTLYYCRSKPSTRASLSASKTDEVECLACEG